MLVLKINFLIKRSLIGMKIPATGSTTKAHRRSLGVLVDNYCWIRRYFV